MPQESLICIDWIGFDRASSPLQAQMSLIAASFLGGCGLEPLQSALLPGGRQTTHASTLCAQVSCHSLTCFDAAWCPKARAPEMLWLGWNWRDSSPSSNCLLVTYFWGVCWFGHWWLSDSQLIPGETKCACSQPNFMPLGPLIGPRICQGFCAMLKFLWKASFVVVGLGRCSFLACQNSRCSGLMSCRVVGQSAYFQSNSFHAETC